MSMAALRVRECRTIIRRMPGSGVRFVGLSVMAAALVALFGATGASAGTASRTVALTISFSGSGQFWVTGALTWPGGYRYTCSPASAPCGATVHVPRGRRIVLHEQPAYGWRLTHGWSAACYGSRSRRRNYLEQSCALRLTAARSANLTFVPPSPGSYLNPFPVGTTVGVELFPPDLDMTVNSATINATAEVEAVTDPNTGQPVNGPPPAGDQYTLVNLTLTSKESFPISIPDFLSSVWAEGVNSVPYKPDACVPPPLDFGSIGTVDPGQSVTGYLCFTIASTDAATLLLQTLAVENPKIGALPVWLALR